MYEELPAACGFHQMESSRLGDAAMPVSPIEGALAELGKEISALEDFVGKLRARASKVSTPQPPNMPCPEAKEADTGPHSETWHSIRESRQRIASISTDIRELTARLET